MFGEVEGGEWDEGNGIMYSGNKFMNSGLGGMARAKMRGEERRMIWMRMSNQIKLC